MMYWNDGSAGWAGWLVMVFSMAAFWGLLAWVGISLVRSSDTTRKAPPSSRTPEGLLAERFARGEIDEEDYVRRREVLREG